MTRVQKWFMIIAMWAVILFLMFAFYWMMIRPAKIRQMCAARAKRVSAESKGSVSAMLEINRAIYLDCLRCNGIEK